VLRALDHSAIFLLIAGTYTPFTLVSLRGPWGFALFGVVWGLPWPGSR
jgi:hemolysin III